jgi:hypothetical protein
MIKLSQYLNSIKDIKGNYITIQVIKYTLHPKLKTSHLSKR